MLGDRDTIAAISTAKGTGALGIVRISGSLTPEILEKCFSRTSATPWESHRAYYGIWNNPLSQEPVDEVLLLHFENGKGFTGEAAAEIICHGGMQVTELVLRASLDAGARLARPGEFTYRAVMNDKMDLAQAEGVLDLIHSKTPRAAAQALNNIRGGLSRRLEAFESELIYLLAHLEASIDFTTEDIQPVSFQAMAERAGKLSESVSLLLETYIPSRVAAQGLRVVLAGKPNVGKSSLLNTLVGKDRSIVDASPGTTRDTVEEEVIIDGDLFRFIDTAGLRFTENAIEKQGVERALEELRGADLILYVVDHSQGLSNEDVETLFNLGPERTLLCLNKSDLKPSSAVDLAKFGLEKFNHVLSSTLSLEAVIPLRHALVALTQRTPDGETASIVSTERQRASLGKLVMFLSEVKTLLETQASPDLISFSLREGLLEVQQVLGKTAGDDVMDRVFKEFCIGK